MDIQNITLTATENVAPTTSTKMTKEELQQKSDKELLALVEKSKGHTGNDFSEYMNCDFSYSFLTTTLKDRGYENGWHKTSEGNSPVIKPTAICMKKSRPAVMLTVVCSPEEEERMVKAMFRHTTTLGIRRSEQVCYRRSPEK